MSYARFKMTCQRVRAIGGGLINETFFDQASSYPQILANLPKGYGPYEEGRDYWITIEPAFPHRGNGT